MQLSCLSARHPETATPPRFAAETLASLKPFRRLRLMESDFKFLQAQAEKCRRLAKNVNTPGVAATLLDMAKEYDARAALIEAKANKR